MGTATKLPSGHRPDASDARNKTKAEEHPLKKTNPVVFPKENGYGELITGNTLIGGGTPSYYLPNSPQLIS